MATASLKTLSPCDVANNINTKINSVKQVNSYFVCTDWYQVTYGGGSIIAQYLDTTCDFCGGGGGSPGTGDSGPGTSPDDPGNSGTTPPPCSTTGDPGNGGGGGWPPNQNSIQHLTVNDVGDGGMGDPSVCSVPNPNPTILDKLTRSSTLTTDQKNQLLDVLNQLNSNCLGAALINYMTTNTVQFDWSVDPTMSAAAQYNTNGSIKIQDPSTLGIQTLFEELTHAYQNYTTTGGISQYANIQNADGSITYTSGSANIEFEAKLLRDMLNSINNFPGTLAINNDNNYLSFLAELTNNYASYPTSFTANELAEYKIYLSEFIQPQYNANYTNDIINFSLIPSSIFNLTASSTCSHQ